MSNLNKIIIQGEVEGKPDYNGDTATFLIALRRTYKEKGETFNEVNCYDVKAAGKLAKKVAAYESGVSVRIIGKLEQQADGKVVIAADYVDRPAQR